MKKISLLFFVLLCQIIIYSQAGMQRTPGKITGKVIDGSAKEPIEYANIIVFTSTDSSQVTGTVTNKDGQFEIGQLKPGKYYVEVQFISYQKRRFNNIILSRDKMSVDMGTIEISPTAINLGSVVVEGQRSPVSYKIDKKVINVDQMNTALSGNAADVLQNVPSVTVDIDGNVSLRGSTSFTVLVDGRPSILDAQDALQQIPASTIENIEIITNPSAKYDAEGSAGIINIILKKTVLSGISGVSNINAGFDDKYGGDIMMEYKTPFVSTNLSVEYNNMFYPGDSYSNNSTTYNGLTSHQISSGTGTWGRRGLSVRGGLTFNLGESDILSVGGGTGRRGMNRGNSLSYDSWSEQDDIHSYYRSLNNSTRNGYFYGIFMNYLHKFNNTGHEISAEIFSRNNNPKEESLTESYTDNIINNGIKSLEDGPSHNLDGQLDYTLPFGGSSKFEAGWRGEYDYSEDNNNYYSFDKNLNDYVFNSLYSHVAKSNESEHSFYSLYAGETGKLGFQGGLRAEYTYRSIKVDDFSDFVIDTWDFFPTLHTSYSFSETDQIMANYTRRIQRPRRWNLEPFDTWTDANNVRRGNPSLKSEYIDSYEAAFKTFVGSVSLSTELYYRVTNNKMEDINSAYSDNVTLTTFQNVGKDYSTGTEIMLNFGYDKLWDANLMGNLYNYKIEGSLFDQSFARESFNWNMRFNNNLKLLAGTQLQVNSSYNSSSVSSQGKRDGFFTADVAVKQDLFEKALSLTLQIQDIFASGKFKSTSSGPDFSSYRTFERDAPVFMLNVKYSINNYKSKDDGKINTGGYEDSGEI